MEINNYDSYLGVEYVNRKYPFIGSFLFLVLSLIKYYVYNKHNSIKILQKKFIVEN